MVTTFDDRHGNTWEVAVTPHEYKTIREDLDFDCYDIVLRGLDEDKEAAAARFQKAILKLETDDEFLGNLLYCCVDEEAVSLNISHTKFVRGLDGDALNAGLTAFLQALTNFFREPAYRNYLQKFLEFLTLAKEQANNQAIAEIDKADVGSLVRNFIDSVGNSPESSELIQGVLADRDGPLVTPS